MKYTLNEILNFTNGKCGEDFDGEKTVYNYLSDSRKIEGSGNMFVALSGDRFNGHEFVGEITSSGDNFAIIEDISYLSKNTICVPDVRMALYSLATEHRKNHLKNVKCVAVTGSVGKTSTKEYVYSVFSSKYNTYKSPGNQNSYTGLPMVVLNCPEEAEYAVLELGMNTAGEIEKLSNLVLPDIGIITNIGWSHSEYLGGRENIFKEKLDITCGMRNGILVVNGDDDLLSGKIDRSCDVVRCSVDNPKADFVAKDIYVQDGKTYFTVNNKKMFICQLGIHNVKNSLLAYAAGISSGMSHDEASYGLSKLSSKESRMKVREGRDGCTVIDDCYNAAPESMKAALDFLSSKKGLRVAILGDMLELGEFSASLHEEVGRYAADKCDVLLCYGNFSKFIEKGAKENGHKKVLSYKIEDREALCESVKTFVDVDTSILFKASNRMRFGEIITLANL